MRSQDGEEEALGIQNGDGRPYVKEKKKERRMNKNHGALSKTRFSTPYYR